VEGGTKFRRGEVEKTATMSILKEEKVLNIFSLVLDMDTELFQYSFWTLSMT